MNYINTCMCCFIRLAYMCKWILLIIYRQAKERLQSNLFIVL